MDKSKTRENNWQSYYFKNFHPIFLKGITYSGEAAYCPSIIKQYKKIKPDVNVVCNISSLTGLKLINYFIRKGIEYDIEGDGAFNNKCSYIKKKIKERIFGHADKLFYTSDEHKKYLLSYGAKNESLHHYPFSSISEKEILSETLREEKRNLYRKEFNIANFTFLSVGRFLTWKNFETTIKSFKIVDSKSNLIIIGGTPTEEYKKIIKENNIENISFLPFMNKEELYRYMQASDCFVFSSTQDIWGLVINEAMANGLPVLSSKGTLSAVEMSKNNPGIILFDNKDEKRLSELMKLMINIEENKLKEMIKSNFDKIHSYTLEKMCQYHVDYLLKTCQ